MHTRVLRELVDITVRPLAIIFERSWQSEEVPEDQKKVNIIPAFKNGKKEDPRNYRLVILTSVSGKMMEQLTPESISKHMENKKVIRGSHHGFTKGKS